MTSQAIDPAPARPSPLASFGWFLVYFALVIVGGALVGATLAIWGLRMGGGFWHELCADNPARIVRRVQTLLAVLLAPWMLRRIGWGGFRDLGWASVGSRDVRRRDFLIGLVLGLVIMAGLYALSLYHGLRNAVPFSPATWGKSILTGLLITGMGVGVIEETLTRGVLYRSMARAWTPWVAALLSSILFAWAHFMKASPASFNDGAFAVLRSSIVGQLTRPDSAVKFVNLCLFGIVLCRMVRHRGDIWLAVGLHAGAVGMARALSGVSVANFSRPASLWVSRNAKFDDSLLLTVLLVALLAALEIPPLFRRERD